MGWTGDLWETFVTNPLEALGGNKGVEDPQRQYWGGSEGAAQNYQDEERRRAEEAQRRAGVTIDYSGAESEFNRALAAREQQQLEIDRLSQLSQGVGMDAYSRRIMEEGRSQALASAATQQASARGGNRALAARAALNAGAQGTAAAHSQGQMQAFQRQENARNAMFAAMQSQRQGDLAAADSRIGMSQAQADMLMQQRALNDRYADSAYGRATRGHDGQAAQDAAYVESKYGAQRDRAAADQGFWGSIIGAGSSALGGILGGGGGGDSGGGQSGGGSPSPNDYWED